MDLGLDRNAAEFFYHILPHCTMMLHSIRAAGPRLGQLLLLVQEALHQLFLLVPVDRIHLVRQGIGLRKGVAKWGSYR